ncbi:MAG: hypothetical protein HKN47_26350 [Pirellulaceae bacterium]|nr:hypothetical protein [Pirellulaceae bacterium]
MSQGAPFADGGTRAGGGLPTTSPGSETGTRPVKPSDALKFERPDGWRDGKMSSMRLAAFNVGPEAESAEVTVMAAGGDLRANVARWIGQVIGEQPATDVVDTALENAEKLDVSGRPAQRFLLTGTDADSGNAIDATIVPLDSGASMFIKMTGPVATVNEQRDALGSFLQSLKF